MYNSGGLDTLQELARNTTFLKFCALAEADPKCRGLQLNSFLIMPIQRIPRYQLLITELIKQTRKVYPSRDEEITALGQALDMVRGVAGGINASVGRDEDANRVMQIADMLEHVPKGHTLVIPTRTFVKSSPLQRMLRSGKSEEYMFWCVGMAVRVTGWCGGVVTGGERKVCVSGLR